MPDESTAASEHAILQEITAPLATLPDDPLASVAEVDFPIVLRGYDRLAVDAYVKRTSQLVAELQATRSPEAAVRRGLERVGEEVAGILQRAHEAASQITAQSRIEAEDRLERSRQEAAQMTADADRRLQDLDTETDRIWAERQRIVDDAQDLARQLLSLAEAAADRFPAAEESEGAAEGPGGNHEGTSPARVAAFLGAQARPGEPDEPDFDEAPNGSIDAPAAREAEEDGEEAGAADSGSAEAGPADSEVEGPDDTEATRVMPPVVPPEEDEPGEPGRAG